MRPTRAGSRSNVQARFYCTEEEWAVIEKAARLAQQEPKDYIRDLVLAESHDALDGVAPGFQSENPQRSFTIVEPVTHP